METIQHILGNASFQHWIPAFAGMTCFYHAATESLIPAKAGIQSAFARVNFVVT